MRTSALLVLVLSLFSASSLLAAPVSEAERDAIRREVLRRIRIEPERLEDPALARVFDATFFTTEVRIEQGGGSSTSATIQLARHEDAFVELDAPTTDQELPTLLSLVEDGFRIMDEADAKVFEKALDRLYPMSTSKRAQAVKAIVRKDGEWVFVRGTFFEDVKGFLVATDESGRLTGIRQRLRLPKD